MDARSIQVNTSSNNTIREINELIILLISKQKNASGLSIREISLTLTALLFLLSIDTLKNYVNNVSEHPLLDAYFQLVAFYYVQYAMQGCGLLVASIDCPPSGNQTSTCLNIQDRFCQSLDAFKDERKASASASLGFDEGFKFVSLMLMLSIISYFAKKISVKANEISLRDVNLSEEQFHQLNAIERKLNIEESNYASKIEEVILALRFEKNILLRTNPPSLQTASSLYQQLIASTTTPNQGPSVSVNEKTKLLRLSNSD